MVAACIKYFFLVQSALAKCNGVTKDCQMPSSLDLLLMVQHHSREVTISKKQATPVYERVGTGFCCEGPNNGKCDGGGDALRVYDGASDNPAGASGCASGCSQQVAPTGGADWNDFGPADGFSVSGGRCYCVRLSKCTILRTTGHFLYDVYDTYSLAPPPAPAPAPASATPSPTDVSGGHGDPHIVNIRGEKFDIWRLGTVELLRIHAKDNHYPEFRFTANVSSEDETQSDSRCAARYMTSMRFRGSWFGKQEVYIKLVDGEMRVHVGDKSLSPLEKAPIEKNLNVFRPSESLVTVSVGDATINVMPDNAVFKPHFYLNTEVRNLASLGLKIGGILGNDDHTAVAQKPASCESQFVAVRHNVYGSSASATLHD